MLNLSNLTFAIPTYNRNDYLRKLLQSIPVDTGASIVISDNGGFVDETVYCNHANVKVEVSEDVVAMFANWNKCVRNVSTEWFIIPSDDDIYYPEQMFLVQRALEENGNADIIVFGHNVIDENDMVLSSWNPNSYETYNSPFGYKQFQYGVEARLPCILFKTQTVVDLGMFDESYGYTAADSLLIQKCLLSGKSVFINVIIGAYRMWSSNFTSKLIGTFGWLERIDKWQNEIEIQVIRYYKSVGLHVNFSPIKDEVFARNLLGAVSSLKQKTGCFQAIRFLLTLRYPYRAKLKTQLRLFKTLFFR